MDALEVVRELIRHLTEEERQTVRVYISSFFQKGKSSRSVTLYDLIVADLKKKEGTETTAKEFESTLYGQQSEANFSRLLYRLREKILEALIIDVNVNREDAYAERTKVNIEVRKNLTQIQILRSRGLKSIAQTILSKVIEQCKKYELFEELLLGLRLQIDVYSEDFGDKHQSKLIAQYEKYNFAMNAVLRAEVNRGKVHSAVDFKSGLTAKVEWLKEMLDQMNTDYRKSTSAQVGFYYFYILTQYYQLQGQYKNARKTLLDNLKLLDTHAGIFTPIRVGNIKLNLADNDLFLREFDRCFKVATESQRYFKATSFNHTQAVELMFYSQYYSSSYSLAREILLQLLPDLDETTGVQYRQGKRLYLLGCTCFMLKDFETAFKLTNRFNNPIEEDREGWNVGMRILTVLSLIELNQLDDATTKVLVLSNFVDSLEKDKVTTRLKHIAVILRKLSNAGFDFKRFYQKEKEKLDSLTELQWSPKSPEMIIVDQWIRAKVFKREFIQEIPVLQQLSTQSPIAHKSNR